MARIGEFVFGTDGNGYTDLIVKTGGARLPVLTGKMEDDNLAMFGQNIFAFTLRDVPPLVAEVERLNGTVHEEVDLFIMHQANKYMLDFLRKKLGVTEEKFYVNFAEIGNTVSSTLPIALKDVAAEGRLGVGMKVVLAGFGVGLSWAGVQLEYT